MTAIPTIGINREFYHHGRSPFDFMDVGGGDKICPLWRHYLHAVDAVMLFVDSTSREAVREAREEVVKYVLGCEEAGDFVVLVAANKQDVEGAMTVREVEEAIDLGEAVGGRRYRVMATSGLTGQGLDEALDWIVKNVKK